MTRPPFGFGSSDRPEEPDDPFGLAGMLGGSGTDMAGIDKVLQLLTAKGLRVRHLLEKKQSLEDVFVTMVESGEPGTDAKRQRPQRVERKLTARRIDS